MSPPPARLDLGAPGAINKALEDQVEARRMLRNKRQNERRAIRRETDPDYAEQLRIKQRERYRRNPEAARYEQRRYHALDTAARLLRSAKKRAKKLDVPFDLTIGYVRQLWPGDGRCPVLGFRMLLDVDRDEGPSLDRFDPNGGYVKGNVRIISFRANRIKSDAYAFEIDRIAAYMRSPDPLNFVYTGEDRP